MADSEKTEQLQDKELDSVAGGAFTLYKVRCAACGQWRDTREMEKRTVSRRCNSDYYIWHCPCGKWITNTGDVDS